MNKLSYVLAGAAGLGAGLLSWGLLVEPRLLDRQRHIARIPRLPDPWIGRQFAVLADLQVGIPLANTGTVERAVREIREQRPAFTLLAGDFVYQAAPNPHDEIEQVTRLIRPLTEDGVATYAVLGNHDYKSDPEIPEPVAEATARELHKAFEAMGVSVLHNEAVPLPPSSDATTLRELDRREDEEAFYLVGIAPGEPDRDDPWHALSQVPQGAPRIVLMHTPETFLELPAGTAPLAIAGHTHGGQIRPPLKPDWPLPRLLGGDGFYLDGWVEGYGQPGNKLYVNRGIGFSTIPIRFACPPELTIFTLMPA